MVYTGYQFEESNDKFNVCYVYCGSIIDQTNVEGLNKVFNWIKEHRQSNKMQKEYDRNFEFIGKKQLKVGDLIRINNKIQTVQSIHPNYGWICTEHQQIRIKDIQDVFNRRLK